MKKMISRLVKEEEGATIIEYVLLAALIAVVSVVAITRLGTNISGKFNEVADKVPAAQ
jgi:pilus assembly protein Flp/PilA